MELNMNQLLKSSAVNGAFLGFGLIVTSMLIYVLSPATLAIWWLNLLLSVLSIVVAGFMSVQFRKSIGGFLTYRNALLYAFAVLTVSSVLALIFNYALFAVIDPDLPEFIKSEVIANTTETLENFGMGQEEIENSLAQIEGQDFTPTLANSFKGFTIGLIFNLVFAAILGAIASKKPSVLESAE
jgi:hypothetical protein